MRRRFASKFNAVKAGANNTWDYQVLHLCLTSKILSITPAKNLVANIGLDERATHTKPANTLPPAAAGCLNFPLQHPERVVVHEKADFSTETHVYDISPHFLASWKHSILKRFPMLRSVFANLFGSV